MKISDPASVGKTLSGHTQFPETPVFETRFRTVRWQAEDGAWLMYRESGASAAQAEATVLMLHSLFFDGRMFAAAAAALPANWRVICPDHRGQGGSERGTRMPTMAQLGLDMAALLQREGVDAVHVVGSSMGGYVALELACGVPGLVRSAVLSCCTAQAEADPARFAALAQRLRSEGAANMIDVIVKTMFGEGFVQSEAPALALWRTRFAALDARIAEAVEGVYQRQDRRAALPGLSMPMLLLSGELDRAKRPADMQEIGDGVPHGQHRCIATAGHTPVVETPEIYGAWLAEFLTQQIL